MTSIVRALIYRVNWGACVDYEKAPAVHVETGSFSLDLRQHELRAQLKEGSPSVQQARALVEDFLKAWELLIGLQHDPDDVRFVFEGAEVEDARVELEAGGYFKPLEAHVVASASVSAVPHYSRPSYPAPPAAFAVSPDVGVMYLRYEGYKQGKEPLLAMASFCLTVLLEGSGEQKGRKKQKATERNYAIDESVLRKLGEICANRGSPREARKAPRGLVFTPLGRREEKWVVAAVKAMIQRAGEVAAELDRPRQQITMQDLPDLGKVGS